MNPIRFGAVYSINSGRVADNGNPRPIVSHAVEDYFSSHDVPAMAINTSEEMRNNHHSIVVTGDEYEELNSLQNQMQMFESTSFENAHAKQQLAKLSARYDEAVKDMQHKEHPTRIQLDYTHRETRKCFGIAVTVADKLKLLEMSRDIVTEAGVLFDNNLDFTFFIEHGKETSERHWQFASPVKPEDLS